MTTLLLLAALLTQPLPPAGGGYGIFTPAGPYNLAGGCLYFDQSGDPDTYLCRSGADEVTLTAGGASPWVCNATTCTTVTVLGPDGTAGNPSFAIASDPDNGMYLSAADTLGFAAGGGLRMSITSSGIFGIPFYSSADGTSGAARFSWQSDTDLGLYRYADNALGLAASAGVYLNGNLHLPGNGYFIFPNTADTNTAIYQGATEDQILMGIGGVVVSFIEGDDDHIDFSAMKLQLQNDTRLASGATDGHLLITNKAGTEGVLIDPITGTDSVTLTDENGNPLRLNVNGLGAAQVYDNFIFRDGVASWWGTDFDSGLKYHVAFTPDTLLFGLPATSNTVFFMEKSDMGTDPGLPLQVDPTLAIWDAGKAHIGALTNEGFWADYPKTDIDPHDIMVNGADAWSQATAGQRDGMNVNLSAGVRTLQLVCADRTLADQDVVGITVNGVLTNLTESTDFDCEGEASEEVCCDNLGAAITTALGATTVVPDCDTTAGTCYLQFDQRTVHVVDSITYTDGGVDGVFGTLTEGADGFLQAWSPQLLAAGSANYPSLGLAADNDGSGTGIYRDAADQIGITTNGTKIAHFGTSIFLNGSVNSQFRIYDSASALNLGGSYAATKGGVTGSVMIGKDAGSISLEVEGVSHFIGDIVMGDSLITHAVEATQSLLAATTITSVNKINPVVGNGGAVVITAAPTITAGSPGDELCLVGTSDANTVEVQDETTIAGSLLELDGDVDMVLGLHDTICFVFYNSHWIETGRTDNDDD
jgi:hypothetical protein